MPSQETFCLEVSSDFACFTRPEMKVERVSYDVITPSAARAVFEAILWKPAIRWQVEKIEVLKPIRWINIRRNEVAGVASQRKPQIFIEDERQQRAGLFLYDVAYRLHARFHLKDDSSENTYPKFAEMFKRRARKGKCFNQPYLGTREFSANFRYIEPEQIATQNAAIDENRDLGWMLYDMDFSDAKNPMPMFYQAKLEKGNISVPAADSEAVRR
jgi:CRISPR-associated protein Cas5d